MSRLFGELATKFGRSPEDLATEGLCYLLRHRVAAEAFVRHLNEKAGVTLPSSMTFRTQEEAEDGDGQPDMRGVAGDGTTQLLVESKFWAGLTKNQPNGYLRELVNGSGGTLLFLVPHPRRPYLWPKIRDEAASVFEVRETNTSESSFMLQLRDETTLVLQSWKLALNVVESAVQVEGGLHDLLEDVHQVQSLCDRYSDEGFHPLRGDELGQDVGKRIHQLTQIVQDLRGRLGNGWGPETSISTRKKWYTFRTKLYGFQAVIGIKYYWWARDGRSPLWLRVKTQSANRRDAVLNALDPDIHAFADKPESYPYDVLIPLPLKLGVERDEVIDDLVEQLEHISERLEPVLKETS